MKTASPQDTYDHLIGSGALSYPWWHELDVYQEGTDDWSVRLVCDSGENGKATKQFGHKDVMKACYRIIKALPKSASQTLYRQCRNLVWDADEADFDAAVADEMLQYLVLGEVVFG